MSEQTLSIAPTQTYRPGVPPVGWMTGGALFLVVIGGILMVAASVALWRAKDFVWRTFRKLFKWGSLAYGISAAMIEFAFVRDHMRGASLVVSCMLLVFALSVPATIAFIVARFTKG